MAWWFLLFGGSASAVGPSFTLDDLDVTLALPEGKWRLHRWSGSDLQVRRTQRARPVDLTAWSTPLQASVAPGEAWKPIFEAHLATLDATWVQPGEVRTEVVAGRPVALVDFTFRLDTGPQVLRGATLAVPGANLHVALTGPATAAGDTEAVRATIIGQMTGAQPALSTYGAPLEGIDITIPLPPAFRPLLDQERPHVPEFEDCAVAIAPRPGKAAEVLALCHRSGRIGILDEHSFGLIEPVVRAGVPDAHEAGHPFPIGDRTGVSYGLEAIVPSPRGLVHAHLQGPGATPDRLVELLQTATLSGPHPASIGDRVEYWLWARPMSLAVVGLIALFGGGLVARTRRKGTVRP